MMGVLILHPATITCGVPFSASIRIEDPTAENTEVDLAAYSVAYALSTAINDGPFHEGTGAIVSNRATFEIAGTDTALFASLPIIGGRPSAVMQITLTAPDPAQTLVLQGPAIIQGVFP
jgi:hypothetical protein